MPSLFSRLSRHKAIRTSWPTRSPTQSWTRSWPRTAGACRCRAIVTTGLVIVWGDHTDCYVESRASSGRPSASRVYPREIRV